MVCSRVNSMHNGPQGKGHMSERKTKARADGCDNEVALRGL